MCSEVIQLGLGGWAYRRSIVLLHLHRCSANLVDEEQRRATAQSIADDSEIATCAAAGDAPIGIARVAASTDIGS